MFINIFIYPQGLAHILLPAFKSVFFESLIVFSISKKKHPNGFRMRVVKRESLHLAKMASIGRAFIVRSVFFSLPCPPLQTEQI